LVSFG
jgi:hypothetical protein